MNRAASHLANRKELQSTAERERFLKVEMAWDKKVQTKNIYIHISDKGTFL